VAKDLEELTEGNLVRHAGLQAGLLRALEELGKEKGERVTGPESRRIQPGRCAGVMRSRRDSGVRSRREGNS
jgi:hypothetical protein